MDKNKMLAVMGAMVFIVYQVTVFILAGFAGHSAVFWETWIFSMIAFVLVALSACIRNLKRDWLFGYPIFLHNILYILAELIFSAIFMALDWKIGWRIPFVIQFIVLGVHVFFVASAFYVKEAARTLEQRIKDKKQYIYQLQTEVEMTAECCSNPNLRKAFKRLAEKLRFSDPMSNGKLEELEKDLALNIVQAKQAVKEKQEDEAFLLCAKAETILLERNKQCKALK